MASQPIMGSVSALPAVPPMPAVARILSRFDRWQVEGFIAVALDLLDTFDGEADFENATDVEDDFALSPNAIGYDTGPGCPASDTGEDHDEDTGVEDSPLGIDPEEDFGGEELGEREEYTEPEVADEHERAKHLRRIRRSRCLALRERDWRTGLRDGPVSGWMLLHEPTVPGVRAVLKRKRGVPKRPRA